MKDEACFFNALAAQWDLARKEDTEKLNFLAAMMNIPDGARVLDVGSGTGVFLPYLKQIVGKTGSITALDFSEAMLARSQEKHKLLGPIKYVCADVLFFDTEETYDVIVCLNFFPHVKNKALFFEKMKNLLCHEGMLVIMHDISRQAVNGIHQECDAVKEDRLPEGTVLTKMLEQAGYRVKNAIDCERYYFVKAVWGQIET